MGKKKKGSRRLSQSDFDKENAFLTQILTESSRKNGTLGSQTSLTPPSSKTDLLGKDVTAEKDSSEIPATSSLSIISTAATEADSMPTQSDSVEKSGGGKCQHVKNAGIKAIKIRIKIGHLQDWNHCQSCLKAEFKAKKLAQRSDPSMEKPSLADAESTVEALPSNSLWICLSCCEINCGRMVNKHALSHHESMKGNHPLCINLGTMDCWCYDCDSQIIPSKNKNQVIQECQVTIEKALQAKQFKIKAAAISASTAVSKKSKGSTKTSALSGSNTDVVPTVTNVKAKVFTPGLQNLGNTCFFNSVAQVLTETKALKCILSENENDALCFPSSLAAKTDAGLGPLTINLKEFLRTMWKQQGGTVSPRELFMQIAKKWKVFKGFRQQDSQELMRYLFDGVKQEEIDMIKRQLSEEAGEGEDNHNNTKANGTTSVADEVLNDDKESMPTNVDTAIEEPPKYVPFIDSCFSGKLVSVIVCYACKKCSYAPEDFFDLSLSVRGPAQAGTTAGSSLKAQLLAKSRQMEMNPPSITLEPSMDEKNPIPASEQPTEAHMRHIEKLLRVIGRSNSESLSIQRSLNQFTGVECLDGDNRFACENCYKLINASKENTVNAIATDTDINNNTKELDLKESDTGDDDYTPEKSFLETPEVGESEDDDIKKKEGKDDDEEHKESVEPEEHKGSVEPEEQEEIEEEESSKGRGEEEKDTKESEEEKGEEDSEEEEDTEGDKRMDSFGNTIQKDKLKSARKDDTKTPSKEDEPKYIFRKAYKRYLISKLPPTLVLHLKRFERYGRFGQMRKIEDHVDIPVELDMSPYFVPKSEIEDEDDNGGLDPSKQQHQDDNVSKKYRLYGAVVHMGSLGSGHYTNFVLSSKVAEPESDNTSVVTESDKKDKSRETKSILGVNGQELQDMPQEDLVAQANRENTGSDQNNDTTPVENKVKEENSERKDEIPADTRRWIACSDTRVRLSSLEEVLSSRAYLLFYERC
ncbi:Ubiquitin carboxyl-terminal hydrolase 16 [Entomortierella lignicola]|nr:Ubiquitin carboxyl-terminal hydrolase 16 [Entomortierella lignicola]